MNIPDQISFSDLEALASKASNDQTPSNPDEPSDYQEKICTIAHKYVAEAYKELPDPMLHKVMMLDIITMMFAYHLHMAEEQLKHDPRCAAGWMQDAGKFQAAHMILSTISMSEQDFTTDITESSATPN